MRVVELWKTVARCARRVAAARYFVVGACLVSLAVLQGCASESPQAARASVKRMYVLYCGEAQVPDISPWSEGKNANVAASFSNQCYLIEHAKGWLIWDTGYQDALANKPEGLKTPRFTAYRKKTLQAQLAEIGVSPDQVTYLAMSHSHADHIGNANMFASSTLLIQKPEYDAAFGADAAKQGFPVQSYDKLKDSKKVLLDGDHDVFGDDSVRIISTPGHTAGHQSLLVRLGKTGAVILTGDVAHFQENWDMRRVPVFNFSHDASLSSMEKISALAQREGAQIWINHDSSQTAGKRLSPLYYD